MKKFILLVLVSLLSLNFTACQSKKPIEQKNEEKYEEIYNYENSFGTIFLKNDESMVIVLDNGEVFPISGENFPELSSDFKFSTGGLVESSNLQVNEDKTITALSYTQPYVRLCVSDYKNAPKNYAKMILNDCLYATPEFAISEYNLKSVNVLEKSEAKIDFEIFFDLKPANEKNYYTRTDSDGFLRDLSAKITIYGIEDRWLSYSDVIRSFSKDNIALKKTSFRPTNLQEIVFISDFYTYYTEKYFLPHSSHDIIFGYPQEYDTKLYSYNNETKKTTKLTNKKRNFDFYKIYYEFDKVYIKTNYWIPFSESFQGPTYMIDEKTNKITPLLSEDSVIDIIGIYKNEGYALKTTDLWKKDLLKIDFKTGKTEILGAVEGATSGDVHFQIIEITDKKVVILENNFGNNNDGKPYKTYEILLKN